MPLKTATDEATNWLPVSTKERVVGICEYTRVEGDTELRTGVGRALPHRGFKALHPNRNITRTSKGAKRWDGDILFNQQGRSYCDCSAGVRQGQEPTASMPPSAREGEDQAEGPRGVFSTALDSAASAPVSILTFLSGKYAHGKAAGDSSLSETQNATTQQAHKPLARSLHEL